MAVVTPTDRPRSVRNRCVIELFCGVVCVVTLPFWHFCWCRGLSHRTESDLFLFLLRSDDGDKHHKEHHTFHKFYYLDTDLDLYRFVSGFHGSFATGVACQQGTFTLSDTWFLPFMATMVFYFVLYFIMSMTCCLLFWWCNWLPSLQSIL